MNTDKPFESIGSIFGNLKKPPEDKNPLVINPKFILENQKDDLQELAQKVGFSANAFMLFGLPTKRLEGNPFTWEKENPFCKLF